MSIIDCRRRVFGLGAFYVLLTIGTAGSVGAAPFDTTDDPIQLRVPQERPRVRPLTVTLLDDQPFDHAAPYQVPVSAPVAGHGQRPRHPNPRGRAGHHRHDQRMVEHGRITLPVSRHDARDRALASPTERAPRPRYRVYLDITGTETGVQYDRTMTVWAGDVPIFYGTTPEPTAAGITWHVHKNVTRYLPVLTGDQTFTVQLDSYVSDDAGVDGVPRITARLRYYPVRGHDWGREAATDQPWSLRPPTDIVALGQAPVDFYSGVDHIDPGTPMTRQVTLPNNIKRAYVDLYAIAQGDDEFFWGNQPSYRAVEVSIDGQPAGIAWPFPYIFTGGVNPLLWRPIVAIDTLDIPALRIDLTPFASRLGGRHTLAIKVAGNQGYWRAGGSLFVYAGGQPTRGRIVSNNLVFDQASDTETQASPVGDADSHFGESTVRDFEVRGTVDGATASVVYHDIYSNDQYAHSDSVQWVHASQVSRTVSRIAGGRPLVYRDIESYTLDGPNAYFTQGDQFVLPATVVQSREIRHAVDGGTRTNAFRERLLERVQGQAVYGSGLKQGATTGVLSYDNSRGRHVDRQIRARGGEVVYRSTSDGTDLDRRSR